MIPRNKKYLLFPKPHFKHCFLLFFFLASLIKKTFQINFELKKSKALEFFKLYIYNAGDLINVIPYLIIRKRTKDKKIKVNDLLNPKNEDQISYLYYKRSPNKYVAYKHIIIYTIIDFIAQISGKVFALIIEEHQLEVKQANLNSILVVNMLVILLFSRLILHTKFYRHNCLAIIINVLCLIILSIIDIRQIINNSGEYIGITIGYIFVQLFSISLYSYIDVLSKVIFLYDFITPYHLLLAKSIIEDFLLLLFSIPFIFIKLKGDEDDEPRLIFSMIGDLFENKIFILVVFGYAIISFFYNIFLTKLIDEFSPNHFIIGRVFENFGVFILNLIIKGTEKENNIALKIIIFILLIIASFIYNEFIVINICGFGKNTQLLLDYEAFEENFIKTNANDEDNNEKIDLNNNNNTKTSENEMDVYY